MGSGGTGAQLIIRQLLIQLPLLGWVPASTQGWDSGIYPQGNMTRGSQPAGSPGQSCIGTCSGLSGFQQVPPFSLAKLGSKATRQERWPPLGVIQSLPAPRHLPGGPQCLQVGGPCSNRAPAQIHRGPQDTCCHLHADLLRTGLDGGPGRGLPRGSHLHLLWGAGEG